MKLAAYYISALPFNEVANNILKASYEKSKLYCIEIMFEVTVNCKQNNQSTTQIIITNIQTKLTKHIICSIPAYSTISRK